MRIAHVSTVHFEVPPKAYGGIESSVADLVLEQANSGHDVTLYTVGNSTLNNRNITVISTTLKIAEPMTTQSRLNEIRHFIKVIKDQSKFDFIHFHVDPMATNVKIDGVEHNLLELINVPFVSTMYNYFDNMEKYYIDRPKLKKIPVTVLSKHYATRFNKLVNIVDIVPLGIDINNLTYSSQPHDYLFFIGRLNKFKGPLDAIQVAKATGKKLIIASRVDDTNREYFNNTVKSHIDGEQIVHYGEATFEQKIILFRNALVTLFPISWPEPFGLVMIESMACGTPVLAYDCASVPEIIQNGKTGYICNDLDEMISRVNDIQKIDRYFCRQYVEEKYSRALMAKNYIDTYNKIINRYQLNSDL